jgi:hypothetical protein
MNAKAARLFFGQVMHRRLRPAEHRFVYPVYFCVLPLSEVACSASALFSVNRWNLFSFHLPTTVRVTARIHCPGYALCWNRKAYAPMAKSGCSAFRAFSVSFSTRSACGSATTVRGTCSPSSPR